MEQVKRKKSDRISLTLENNEKLNTLLEPFSKWCDVVSVTKSDLVNFIISGYGNALSANEVKTLLKAIVNRSERPKERKPRQKKAPLSTTAALKMLSNS